MLSLQYHLLHKSATVLSKLEHKYDVMMLKMTEINKESAKKSQCYNFFLFIVRLYLASVSFA